MSDWYMVVGLGNPGREYHHTRHNIGWMALDELAHRYSLKFDETQHKAALCKTTIQGRRTLLVKPQTYMNLSGQSVQPLSNFYKVDPSHIMVVNDDLDIPLGSLRIRSSGSAGGQKGLKDIITRMGTDKIARTRMGIGRPPGRMSASDYVLQTFMGDDAILAAQLADRAADAIETWLLSADIEWTMSQHNNTDVNQPRVGVARPKVKPPQSEGQQG